MNIVSAFQAIRGISHARPFVLYHRSVLASVAVEVSEISDLEQSGCIVDSSSTVSTIDTEYTECQQLLNPKQDLRLPHKGKPLEERSQ